MANKILDEGVANFFYKKKEYRSLSNFWECEVIIQNEGGGLAGATVGEPCFPQLVYETGEHCFHGQKYLLLSEYSSDEKRKQQLFDYGSKFSKPSPYKTSAEAKKMGGKKGLRLTEQELALWSKLSVEVQKKICKYKYDNYEEVRNNLFKSKNKILIHPAMRTSEEKLSLKFWEGKGVIVDGKIVVLGHNMLGKLWMDLRDDII